MLCIWLFGVVVCVFVMWGIWECRDGCRLESEFGPGCGVFGGRGWGVCEGGLYGFVSVG